MAAHPGSGTLSANLRCLAERIPRALLVLLTALPALAAAQSVELQGLLPGGKAVVSVAGAAPRIVQAGALLDGARLVSVDAQAIVLESGGRQQRVVLGSGPLKTAPVAAVAGEGGGRAVLSADSRGHFLTTGYVNGKPQPFLIDTGASIVALSKSDASRLGINLANGKTVVANTANGQAFGTAVRIDTLRIGDIVVHNTEAWIMDNLAGPALLGMSFLNRTAMQREGGTLTLIKRY